MRCIDPDDVLVYGDYNSYIARQLRISIETCTNTTENGNHCKSPEVIEKWLQNKYINIQYNQILFNTTDYHEHSVDYSSHFKWLKTSSTYARVLPFKITNYYAITQDYRIHLDDVTEKHIDYMFEIASMEEMP